MSETDLLKFQFVHEAFYFFVLRFAKYVKKKFQGYIFRTLFSFRLEKKAKYYEAISFSFRNLSDCALPCTVAVFNKRSNEGDRFFKKKKQRKEKKEHPFLDCLVSFHRTRLSSKRV